MSNSANADFKILKTPQAINDNRANKEDPGFANLIQHELNKIDNPAKERCIKRKYWKQFSRKTGFQNWLYSV